MPDFRELVIDYNKDNNKEWSQEDIDNVVADYKDDPKRFIKAVYGKKLDRQITGEIKDYYFANDPSFVWTDEDFADVPNQPAATEQTMANNFQMRLAFEQNMPSGQLNLPKQSMGIQFKPLELPDKLPNPDEKLALSIFDFADASEQLNKIGSKEFEDYLTQPKGQSASQFKSNTDILESANASIDFNRLRRETAQKNAISAWGDVRKNLQSELKEEDKKSNYGSFAGAGRGVAKYTTDRYKQLQSVVKYGDQMLEALNAPEKNEGSWYDRLWKGIKDADFKNILTFGASSVVDAFELKNTLKRVEQAQRTGQPVSEEDTEALKLYQFANMVNQSKDPATLYNIGKQAPEQFLFMAQMALSGGTVGAFNALLSKATKKIAAKSAKTILGKGALNAAKFGVDLGKVAGGGVIASAMNPQNTAKGVLEDQAGQYSIEFKTPQQIAVTKPFEESFWKTATRSYGRSFIEMASENVGGVFFDDIVNAAGKALGKGVGYLVPNRFQNSKFLNKLSESYKALHAKTPNYAKGTLGSFTEAAKIDNYLSEIGEEYVGKALNNLLPMTPVEANNLALENADIKAENQQRAQRGLEPLPLKTRWSNFFDKDEFLEIAGTIGMTALPMHLGAAQINLAQKRSRLREKYKAMPQDIRDEVSEAAKHGSEDDFAQAMRDLNLENETSEVRNSVADYLSAKIMYDLAVSAKTNKAIYETAGNIRRNIDQITNRNDGQIHEFTTQYDGKNYAIIDGDFNALDTEGGTTFIVREVSQDENGTLLVGEPIQMHSSQMRNLGVETSDPNLVFANMVSEAATGIFADSEAGQWQQTEQEDAEDHLESLPLTGKGDHIRNGENVMTLDILNEKGEPVKDSYLDRGETLSVGRKLNEDTAQVFVRDEKGNIRVKGMASIEQIREIKAELQEDESAQVAFDDAVAEQQQGQQGQSGQAQKQQIENQIELTPEQQERQFKDSLPKNKKGDIAWNEMSISDIYRYNAYEYGEEAALRELEQARKIKRNTISQIQKQLENTGDTAKRQDLLGKLQQEKRAIEEYNAFLSETDNRKREQWKHSSVNRKREQWKHSSVKGAGFSDIVEKWNKSPKTEGFSSEIRLANGEKIKGRYVLTEQGAFTPSHDVNRNFSSTAGFPTNEAGENVNDRDYSSDKAAQALTLGMAQQYDSRAMSTGGIVVDAQSGVTLSGNGRTMAGQIAAQQNTDGSYIEHITEYAQNYGFTAEQIQAMQHPRIVFVAENPIELTTENFKKFNADEKKSQSTTEKAKAQSKSLNSVTAQKISDYLNDIDNLSEVYNDPHRVDELLSLLMAEGVIQPSDRAQFVNENGTMTGTGQDFLETVMLGAAFQGKSADITQIMKFDQTQKTVILKAVAKIIETRTFGRFDITDYLSEAIEIVSKANESGTRVEAQAIQQDAFRGAHSDQAINLAMALAIDDRRKTTKLRDIFEDYNNSVREEALGEVSMFEQREPAEVLMEVLKLNGLADVYTGERKAKKQSEENAFNPQGTDDLMYQVVNTNKNDSADEIKKNAIAKGTFMKAPNGKPTKLNEKQWLQVRTSAFKKWFGDWEKANKLQLIEDLVAIGIVNHNLTEEQLLETYKQIGEVKNKIDNINVRFVNSAYDKITYHRGISVKKIVPQLKEIFEDSIPIISESENLKDGHKEHNNFSGHNHYLGKIKIDGIEYYVRFTAQQLKPSIKKDEKIGQSQLHNTAISEISIYKKSGSSVTTAISTAATPTKTALVDTKLQQFFETAKYSFENSSKVVDENGEPLVVAHSTNKDFYEFKDKQQNDSGWLGAGYYFFGDRSLDGQYGKNVMETFLNIRNPYYASNEEVNRLSEVNSNEESSDFSRELQGEGYDGVYFNGNLNQEFVAFSPNQIKSATDNIGNFDNESGDIRSSKNQDLTPIRRKQFKNLIEVLKKTGLAKNILTNKQAEKILGKDGTRAMMATVELNATNARWNEELKTLTADNARSKILWLGNPSNILQTAGIENKPLKLYGAKLVSKAKRHGFNFLDLKNLPQAVQNPIAIFKGSVEGSHAILTELNVKGNNVLVTLNVGKDQDIDFNIITSAYGKSNDSIVGWLNKGKLLYTDKEKTLNYLRISAPIAEAQDKTGFSQSSIDGLTKQRSNYAEVSKTTAYIDAAKILKNFDNPKLSEENFEITDKIRPMATPKGEIYGFVTPEGDVWIDENNLNANTPIHEFGHLFWSAAMPAEMKAQITALLKNTNEWQRISKNPAYANLKTDDQKADEVFNTLLGSYGESSQRVQEIIGRDIMLIARVKTALKGFWEWLKGVFNSAIGLPVQGRKYITESARMQAYSDNAAKVEQFILDVLDAKVKNGKQAILLPQLANRLAEKALGHPIKSHRIKAEEIRHIENRHGINGAANKEYPNSIPLRKEDIALLPYIMSAPDRVEKSDSNSIKYYKDLSNGNVVVVERELGKPDSGNMENITMWASKRNHSTNPSRDPNNNVPVEHPAYNSQISKNDIANDGRRTVSSTAPNTQAVYNSHISKNDTAKIRKDFENAKKAEHIRLQAQAANTLNNMEKATLGELTTLMDEVLEKLLGGKKIEGSKEFEDNKNRKDSMDGDRQAKELQDFLNNTDEGKKLITNYKLRITEAKSQAKKVSDFIKDVLDGKIKDGKRSIEIPEYANKLAEKALGHKIKSHSISASEVRHAWKNHGVGGSKNAVNTIPLKKEDIALMPYIMAAPDKVIKGTPAADGTESVRYYKNLENGYVVVVEREGRYDISDMENVTMWAEKMDNKKSLPPYGAVALTGSNAPRNTSETLIVSPKDAAKIRKDFELAVEREQNRQILFQVINNQDFRDAHTAPSWGYETLSEELENEGEFNLSEFLRGEQNIVPKEYFENESVAKRDFRWENAHESIDAIFAVKRNGANTVKVYRAVPKDIAVDKLINRDWITFSKGYAENHGLARFGEGEYKIIEQEVPIKDVWWDGNDINEWGYDNTNNMRFQISLIPDGKAKVTYVESSQNGGREVAANQEDYDFDVSGITEVNAREMQQIKETAVANGTFMTAPNGQKTNLNERQWLQVRTDAFRKWFGDWELPYKKTNIVKSNKEIIPANISEAKEYAKKNLQGKIFVNRDTGEQISIGRHGIDKTLSGKALGQSVGIKQHLAAIPHIGQILENSLLGETHKDRSNDVGVEAIQRFYGALKHDGQIYRVKTTVKKIKNRDAGSYYTYEIQEMELLPERSIKGEGSLNPDNDTYSISATKLLKNVEKYKDAGKFILDDHSKIVDENGEPMVVYHFTTNGRFTAFDANEARQYSDLPNFYFSTGTEDWSGMGDNLIAAFLNLRNIIEKPVSDMQGDKVKIALEEKGYDGTVLEEEGLETEYAAFYPSQIKSATDNNGNFDDQSGDIRFQLIGDQNAQEMQRIKETAVANGTFMTAPNGQKTNLNERQWLQVRTDAFKRWFGDWEKANKLQLIEDLAAIGIVNHNLTEEQLLETYKQIGEVRNKSDNRNVRFANSTYGKIVRNKGIDTKRIIPQLKEVFENSVPIYSESEILQAGHKEHKNFVGYHNYLGKIQFEGKDYFVRFTVQQEKTNSRSYNPNIMHNTFISDVELYENKNTADSFPRLLTGASSSGKSDAKLQQFFETAKFSFENSSKVVDENGEPMVVYHGTDAKFTEFDTELLGTKSQWRTAHFGFYFSNRDEGKNPYGDFSIPAFLNIRDPYQINVPTYADFDYDYKYFEQDNFKGYDGAQIKVVGNERSELSDTHFIAFNPSQIKSATDNNGNFDDQSGDIRFLFIGDQNAQEMQRIKDEAVKNGTFMKAPNGKDTKLNERQWLQVRTDAFRKWFGDWEKAARVEKLRESMPIEISGKEIKESDDLKEYRKNALEYGKTLRGEYINKDTGEKIKLITGSSRGGIKEVLHHDYENVEHLKSIAAIPKIIENSIYIATLPNTKENNLGITDYRYYVVGLKIDGVDYTVRATIGVSKSGDLYYDHRLTEIEKTKLIDKINGVIKPASNQSVHSDHKDTTLFSILQINDQEISKVVDENGEPMVVYHGTMSDEFNTFEIDETKYRRTSAKGFFFTSNNESAKKYAGNHLGTVKKAFLNITNPEIINYRKKKEYNHRGFSGNPGRAVDFLQTRQNLFNEFKEKNGLFALNVADNMNYSDNAVTDVYVVFNPNQIKSATDNNGNFDDQSGDIRFQLIGDQGVANLDKAEEATTRLDNLDVAREMEAVFETKKKQIDKLRKSEAIEIRGTEIKESNNLKEYRKNAKEYGLSLRGTYQNKDTGKQISISRSGIEEVLSHDFSKEQLQSIAAIPQIVENAIWIETAENEKDKRPDVKNYDYYVCGLKIGGVDYTVKAVIANGTNGERYYDHKLTQIEKIKLLSTLPALQGRGRKQPYSDSKGTTLFSILQVNEQENAKKIKSATDNNGNFDAASEDIRFQYVDEYMNESSKKAWNNHLNNLIRLAEKETDANPTEEQKKAGNYKKGHVTIQGFDISIEQPKGSVRSGVDENGKAWKQKMHNTYGYFKGTKGKDGDHIDVFFGNHPISQTVFVVDQINPNTKEFDEHKVMLGFNHIEDAKNAYLSNYEDNWQGLGNITEVGMDDFREWTNSGTRKIKPFSEYRQLQNNLQNSKKSSAFAKQKSSNYDNGTSQESQLETMVGRQKERRGIYRTVEACNSAGRRSSILSAEDREELEARGINDISEIIETPKHDFKNFKEAEDWAKKNIIGTYHNADTGEDIYVSNNAISKYLSGKAVSKSVDKDAHLSALKQIPRLIETSILRQTKQDRDNNPDIKEIQYLEGAINYKKNNYPVKITVKAYQTEINKAYSYEVMQIESPLGNLNLPQNEINSSTAGFLNADTSDVLNRKGTKNSANNQINPAIFQKTDHVGNENMPRFQFASQYLDNAKSGRSRVAEALDMKEEDLAKIKDRNTKQKSIQGNEYKRRAVEIFQDQNTRIKKMVEAIEEQSEKKLDADRNVYNRLDKMPARTMAKMENFRKQIFNPLLAKINAMAKKLPEQWETGDMKALSELNKNVKTIDTNGNLVSEGSKFIQLFLQAAKKNGHGDILRIFGFYAIAKHAEHRNRYIYQKSIEEQQRKGVENPKGKENGSGITNEEALQVINLFEHYFTKEEIDAFWQAIETVTDVSLNAWFETGRITKIDRAQLKEDLPYFVPLRNWDESETDKAIDAVYSGSGGDSFSAYKSAGGRSTIADNPIAYMANLAQSAILFAEKNDTKRLIRDMAITHKDNGHVKQKRTYRIETVKYADGDKTNKTKENRFVVSWREVDEIPKKTIKTLDGKEKEVRDLKKYDDGSFEEVVFVNNGKQHIDRAYGSQHEIEVWVNGNRYILEFADEQVARELNRDRKQAWIAGSWLGKSTKFMASLMTQKNPVFMIKNTLRDAQQAYSWLYVSEGTAMANQFISIIGSAGKTVAIANFADKKGLIPTSESDKYKEYLNLYEEYRNSGSRVGYFQAQNVDQWKSEIEKTLKHLDKAGKTSGGNWLKIAGRAFEILPSISEDTTRFAAFAAARKMGKSVAEASNIAKEVTVNFNRAGEWSGVLGAFWAFFNATVQGMANHIALFRINPKRALIVSAVHVVLGFLNYMLGAMILDALGGDDQEDKIRNLSNYRKYINLFVPTGGIRFAQVPLSQSWRPFFAIGVAAGQVMRDELTPQEAIWNTAKQFANYLPIEVSSEITALAPTVTQPILQTFFTRKDFMGTPLVRGQKNDNIPNNLQGVRSDMMPLWEYAADFLTWGDQSSESRVYMNKEGEVEKLRGANLSPDQIRNLVIGYTGGLGTLADDIINMVINLSDPDKEVQANKIPLVSGFFSKAPPNYYTNKYYRLMDALEPVMASVKKDLSTGRIVEYAGHENFEAYVKLTGMMETAQELMDEAKEKELKKIYKYWSEDTGALEEFSGESLRGSEKDRDEIRKEVEAIAKDVIRRVEPEAEKLGLRY